jgi:hypothetical protein
MDTLDPAGEYLRIAERYRQMSNEEILVLVPQSSGLTELAQQALASEVRSRGLKFETAILETAIEDDSLSNRSPFGKSPATPKPVFVEQQPPRFRDAGEADFASPESSDEAESPYKEDRKLVDLCTVYSERDALKVQAILDQLGFPFYMGPEQATGVDTVKSDFSKGLIVQIMQIGMPWAMPAMRYYEPQDDPSPKEPEQPAEAAVRCPTCHSEEIIRRSASETGRGNGRAFPPIQMELRFVRLSVGG